MHFLVISKLPEFTPEGEVIPGQCEPYTGNWRLRLIEDGREEIILAGTYYETRRVQRQCAGRPVDDIRKLAAEAAEEIKNAAASGADSGNDANESTQILGMDEMRRAMLEMELSAAVDDFDDEAQWLSVSQQNGVAVASIGSDVTSIDAGTAAETLDRAFGSSDSAFVIDLGAQVPAGTGFADHLRRLAARARQSGRFLALVGGSDDLAAQLSEDSSETAPCLFADLESALSAAAEAHEGEDAAGTPPEDHGSEPQGE